MCNIAMDDNEKCLKYLVKVEKLAEEILSDKRSLIFLDKQRNENREAFRALGNSTAKKCHITIGGNLIKCPLEVAKEMLSTEQSVLETEINKIRSELKIKVNALRDLECKPPVPGLMLSPLSSKENAALSGRLY